MIQQTEIKSRLEEAFEAFDREHPEVFSKFYTFALQAIASGRKRIGAKAVVERIRWETMLEQGTRPFKINNNFTPYLARKFGQMSPAYSHVFETRKVASDVWRGK